MIRRAFWLSVGAAAGITTYRRASAVGHAISVRVTGDRSAAGPGPFWPPQPGQPGQPPQPPQPGQPGQPAPWPMQPRPQTHQPRPARSRPQAQWSTARAAWRTSRAAWRTQKAAIAQVRAVGRFAHDVREGMDMYMNRHDERPGPTLTGTAGTTPAPGATATSAPKATAPDGRTHGRTDHVKDGR